MDGSAVTTTVTPRTSTNCTRHSRATAVVFRRPSPADCLSSTRDGPVATIATSSGGRYPCPALPNRPIKERSFLTDRSFTPYDRGMGRPRGFDEDQAVRAAVALFGRRAYDGVSVDELVE